MTTNIREPLVTVAMVTYNSEKYVDVAIQSVLASSYKNFELIISDDASKDNTWNIIQSYEDTRIRAYRNSKNIGEYPNRNKCIELANGKYLIFIDGDDYLYPDGLEYLIHNIKKFPNINISMVIGRNWDENIIYPCIVDSKEFILSNYLGIRSLLGLNFTRILFNTKILKESTRFDDKYRIGDFYIQYLLGLQNKVLIVKEGFAWWRRNSGQASESILLNGEVSAESFNIQYRFLNDTQCPLSIHEKEKCSLSITRDFGRLLINKLIKLKFCSFLSLLKISEYPLHKLPNAFRKNQKNYFYSNLSEKNK